MSVSSYMQDHEFDALVDSLHDLAETAQTPDRWEIRVLLARYGVLPLRVAAVPSMEDSLVASLRTICGQGRAERKRHAA